MKITRFFGTWSMAAMLGQLLECLFTQDIYRHTYELAIESSILNIQVFNQIFRAANKYISRNVAKQVQCCYYQYSYTLIEYHDCWKGEPATGSNNTKVAMVAHVYIPTTLKETCMEQMNCYMAAIYHIIVNMHGELKNTSYIIDG